MTATTFQTLVDDFANLMQSGQGAAMHFDPRLGQASAFVTAAQALGLTGAVVTPSMNEELARTLLSEADAVLVDSPFDSKLMGGEILVRSLMNGAFKGEKLPKIPTVFVRTSKPERFPQLVQM